MSCCLQLLPQQCLVEFENVCFFCSTYPSKRVTKTEEGQEMGVIGTIDLLQNTALSTQPISSFDWSPDKQGLCVCTAFDQTLRVLITTKLNQY